jgi:hypothetical protein
MLHHNVYSIFSCYPLSTWPGVTWKHIQFTFCIPTPRPHFLLPFDAVYRSQSASRRPCRDWRRSQFTTCLAPFCAATPTELSVLRWRISCYRADEERPYHFMKETWFWTNSLAGIGDLLQQLTVAQLVNISFEFYGNRGFITVFTKTCHWSVCAASYIQSRYSYRSYLAYVLTLSFRLRLDLSKWPFPFIL